MHHLGSLLTRRLVALTLLVLITNSARAIVYQIEPGSTITPYFTSSPTGPAEPLTGTFTWDLYSTDTWVDGGTTHYQYNFLLTAMNLQSASFTLTRDSNPIDGFNTSATRPELNDLSFSGEVIATGLGSSRLSFIDYPLDSTFEGSASSPTRLICPSASLYPQGGGNWYGRLSFTAVAVPEPGSLSMLGFGLWGMRWWLLRRKDVAGSGRDR